MEKAAIIDDDEIMKLSGYFNIYVKSYSECYSFYNIT
jgi:hypothetical protein